MNIRRISIENWRNFDSIEIIVPEEVKVACLIGANGTGKSHVIELISAVAHEIGLASGVDVRRGNPLADEHDFQVEFFIEKELVESLPGYVAPEPVFEAWDGMLLYSSSMRDGARNHMITAPSLGDSDASGVASRVTSILRASERVHYLVLDADRAYPKKQVQSHELGDVFSVDWETPQWSRNKSFIRTQTLYDEWQKYCLSKENQAGTDLITEYRAREEDNLAAPEFIDPFANYSSSLGQVLPHLRFDGVDLKERTVRFDTAGTKLLFHELSGGEQEIAFMTGQVDRFGLRDGLFLLDEPELHLNSDLIRTWVRFLTSTVDRGQVWLATHSLEAVEVAGADASFLLRRDDVTRRVVGGNPLSADPIASTLAREVGSPAFSIASQRFVYVEGHDEIGERARFQRIVGGDSAKRYIEGGSCAEVVRRVATIRDLALEANQPIRVGGVVDRDWLSTTQAEDLYRDSGVFVLPVHEIENFFLAPATLINIGGQNGIDEAAVLGALISGCDSRALNWIFQTAKFRSCAAIGHTDELARYVHSIGWCSVDQDFDSISDRLVELFENVDGDIGRFKRQMEVARRAYTRLRADPDKLWKRCEGKQVFHGIGTRLGFADWRTAEKAIFALWRRDPETRPIEVEGLIEYVNAL